jgi:hypothetical protein
MASNTVSPSRCLTLRRGYIEPSSARLVMGGLAIVASGFWGGLFYHVVPVKGSTDLRPVAGLDAHPDRFAYCVDGRPIRDKPGAAAVASVVEAVSQNQATEQALE